jgi:hypothetical protein
VRRRPAALLAVALGVAAAAAAVLASAPLSLVSRQSAMERTLQAAPASERALRLTVVRDRGGPAGLDATVRDGLRGSAFAPGVSRAVRFGGRPHLRVENRVLPAGPTVVDTLANAAFYYGLVRVLVDDERPIWSRMSFAAAEDNFHSGARNGLDARLYWPGVGEAPAGELVLRKLLPMAREGLTRWGVDAVDADRLLEIIERRCVLGINGASWQAAAFHRLYERLDRPDALREMTVRYRELMHSNEPVHSWPVE